MAITKLLHLKQSKGTPSRSLKNCLNYIMNPEKTRNGYLVGGNVGRTADEVYNSMLETKQYFNKLQGRQGYHFVISFRPGETNPVTAMNIALEFCNSYIPDYESCYAVHEDKEHIHVHICFNSIDMMEGKKYHYENGKWKKEIQPLVDSLCVKYGLKPLEYTPKKTIHRKNYEQWESEKLKPFNYDNRKDIDAAIGLAEDYQDFLRLLRQIYEIREGYSKKWNSEYFTMKGRGMTKGRRNYSLGKLYTVEAIKERILLKLKGEKIPLPAMPIEQSLRLQIDFIRKSKRPQKKEYGKQTNYYMSFYWRMKNNMTEPGFYYKWLWKICILKKNGWTI